MTMDNHEYLKAYLLWKDQVNTEDQDTPERFDFYLQSLKDAETLEFARESFSTVMDSLTGTETKYTSARVRELFIGVAEDLGLDTQWWKPNVKLEALAARPTVFADDDAKAD